MYNIDLIRKGLGQAISSRCQETKSQKISFEGMGDCISVKGESLPYDKAGLKEKRCDCIIICEKDSEIWAAVLELRSKTINPKEVIAKLENCNRSLDRKILPLIGKNARIQKRAFAVLSKGGRNLSALKVLRHKTINGEHIQTIKYGQKLSNIRREKGR
jgi:hypothetical protein